MTLEEAVNFYAPILQKQFNLEEYGKVLFFPDGGNVRNKKFIAWMSKNYQMVVDSKVDGGLMISFATEEAENRFLNEAEQQKTLELLSA